jgi:methionyl-tRNA formyltransferase
VTLHYMVEKADRGDIVAQRRIAIDENDTALTLHRKAAQEARILFRETYPALVAGTAPRIPQDSSRASYFGARRPEDGEIDWRWSARRVYDLVRAVTHPYPGAFTWDGDERLLVWSAKPAPAAGLHPGEIRVSGAEVIVGCGDGALRVERVARDGEPESSAIEWTRRAGRRSGERLGRSEP